MEQPTLLLVIVVDIFPFFTADQIQMERSLNKKFLPQTSESRFQENREIAVELFDSMGSMKSLISAKTLIIRKQLGQQNTAPLQDPSINNVSLIARFITNEPLKRSFDLRRHKKPE